MNWQLLPIVWHTKTIEKGTLSVVSYLLIPESLRFWNMCSEKVGWLLWSLGSYEPRFTVVWHEHDNFPQLLYRKYFYWRCYKNINKAAAWYPHDNHQLFLAQVLCDPTLRLLTVHMKEKTNSLLRKFVFHYTQNILTNINFLISTKVTLRKTLLGFNACAHLGGALT
jgi:hypothetical protein